MPAPLSIIIPTLNAAEHLPATADALLSGVTDGLTRELIVSDGGSTDNTVEVARELGAVIVEGASGRGQQIARGTFASKAPWMLILHADTCLSENWVWAVREHINGAAGKAGYFRLRFDATGAAARVVARGANLRSRYLGLPYGDQGLLISRRLLKQVGGFPEVALMEDVIMAERLKGRLVELDANAVTSPERYERDGWGRRVLRNLTTLTRYKLGANPDTLVKGYAADASSKNKAAR